MNPVYLVEVAPECYTPLPYTSELRRCGCGTILNGYNTGRKCLRCTSMERHRLRLVESLREVARERGELFDAAPTKAPLKICLYCHQAFPAKNPRQQYCTSAHQKIAKTNRHRAKLKEGK